MNIFEEKKLECVMTDNNYYFNPNSLNLSKFSGILTPSEGNLVWENGDSYEGGFTKCKYDGNGFLNEGKICYQGEFTDGQKNGYGFYRSSEYEYEGNWVNEKEEGKGKGKKTYWNGRILEGDWVNGCFTGNGKEIFGKSTYTGSFHNELFHGYGKLIVENIGYYEGEWNYGKKHGKGTMKFEGDRVYEGEWVDDKREGKGKMTYPPLKVYEGLWKNDRWHGPGTVTDIDWFFSGNFMEGKAKGLLEHNNGNKQTLVLTQEPDISTEHEGEKNSSCAIY